MQVDATLLIKKFFELRNLSKYKQWDEENFKNNKPRLYRYRQLKALFEAYDIPFDIKKFRKGRFINSKDKRYNPFIKDIGIQIRRNYQGESLAKAWVQLFDYYASLQKSLCYTDGVILSSGAYSFVYRKIKINNKKIRENLTEIENILATFISPTNKSFSLKELSKKYHYPIVDLDEIDMENW